MTRFSTDELVAASALLVSGVISLGPDESLTSMKPPAISSYQDHPKSEQEASLVNRLGLSKEQQRLIRQTFEKKRSELKYLSEELDRQREEIYNLRFQYTEEAERRLDTLAALHIETRLALHSRYAEMQRDIEATLTPSQKSMAAHLRHERTLPTPDSGLHETPTRGKTLHH